MNFLTRAKVRLLHSVDAAAVLRLALAAVFLSHGLTRALTDRVTPFATALDAWGFPFSMAWAWGVTSYEIIGGLLLLAGVALRPVCTLFIVQMLVGIWFVHWPNGWFVVGHGYDGMEFSVTLIACLTALFLLSAPGTTAAASHSPHQPRHSDAMTDERPKPERAYRASSVDQT